VLALLAHHLLDLAGTYGDPEAGDPIQYDELRIEHDQGNVEIVLEPHHHHPAVHDRRRSGEADSSGVLRPR